MTSATPKLHIGMTHLMYSLQRLINITAVIAITVLLTPGVKGARIGNSGIPVATESTFLVHNSTGRMADAEVPVPLPVPGKSKPVLQLTAVPLPNHI